MATGRSMVLLKSAGKCGRLTPEASPTQPLPMAVTDSDNESAARNVRWQRIMHSPSNLSGTKRLWSALHPLENPTLEGMGADAGGLPAQAAARHPDELRPLRGLSNAGASALAFVETPVRLLEHEALSA